MRSPCTHMTRPESARLQLFLKAMRHTVRNTGIQVLADFGRLIPLFFPGLPFAALGIFLDNLAVLPFMLSSCSSVERPDRFHRQDHCVSRERL
ncbi:hypothetical protein BaRGS_00012242 [Batillaria attramentaria]|uniref:Uncharacterized protein n=1 Tax=Batillaria attramentaria TaxID=370345 RepID=A0ABD0LB89_9CAEN